MPQDNFAEIEQLVARERLFRARNNPAIRECYFPDATVATSWKKGSLDTFLGATPTEVNQNTPIVGSTSTPASSTSCPTCS